MSGGWLTGQEAAILGLLTGKGAGGEMYGLEMTKVQPDILSPHTIYIVLTRMVAKGFLSSRLEADREQARRGPKRRLYKITSYGQQMLIVHKASDEGVRLAQTLKPAGAHG